MPNLPEKMPVPKGWVLLTKQVVLDKARLKRINKQQKTRIKLMTKMAKKIRKGEMQPLHTVSFKDESAFESNCLMTLYRLNAMTPWIVTVKTGNETHIHKLGSFLTFQDRLDRCSPWYRARSEAAQKIQKVLKNFPDEKLKELNQMIIKKLIRSGASYALILPQPLMQVCGIEPNSLVEVALSKDGNSLVVSPAENADPTFAETKSKKKGLKAKTSKKGTK